MQGEGPLVATVLAGASAAGLVTGVLQVVRFTAPPPERVAEGVAEGVEAVARRTGVLGLLARRLRPLEATGVALTAALLTILAAVALFGAMAVLGTRTHLWVVDSFGAAWGSENAGRLSTAILESITSLGGTAFALPVAVVVAGWLLIRGRQLGPPLFLISVVAGQSLLHNLIKHLVHRDRPPVPRLTGFAGYSFPSGHSATAAATFAALALLLSRDRCRPVSIGLGAAAAALAAMVAASRVLLGVHWVTDVVAGAALGFLWFVACSLAFGGRRLRLAPGALPRLRTGKPGGGTGGAGGLADQPARVRRAGAGRAPAPAQPPDQPERQTMTESAHGDHDTGLGPDPDPGHGPTDEQVDARAGAMEVEPGNQSAAPERRARSLLEESEARVEDPAARVPGDARVIQRGPDEGLRPDEGGAPAR